MRRDKVTIRVPIFVIALFSRIGPLIFLFGDEDMSVKCWDNSNMLRFFRGSLNIGGGDCKWQPPVYQESFYKLFINCFPSGDKRMTFIQMETLTGLSYKDEWDFTYLGMTNYPFIKANYPHHEGIWGWGQQAEQVILVVRNMLRTLKEYHNIIWDIGYAKTWAQASELITNLYSARPPI